MTSLLFLTVLLLFVVSALCRGATSGAATAAVPRGKGKGSGLLGHRGSGLLDRLLREVKISFSSELEALTLQITRPTNAAVPLASLQTLVTFINAEHENPELVVSLLAKLSRKLAEANVFTKIKALLALQHVVQRADDTSSLVWVKAILDMRREHDEKVGDAFFSPESIERAAPSTAQELAATQLARLYAEHVFGHMETLSRLAHISAKDPVSAAEEAQGLLSVITAAEAVQGIAVDVETALSRQCLQAVQEDRAWAAGLLKAVYEARRDELRGELLQEVEDALLAEDRDFRPLRSASEEEQVEDTTDANADDAVAHPADDIPLAARKAVMRAVGHRTNNQQHHRRAAESDNEEDTIKSKSKPKGKAVKKQKKRKAVDELGADSL